VLGITHTQRVSVAKSNLNSTYSQICNKYELKKVYLYFNRTQSCAYTYPHTHTHTHSLTHTHTRTSVGIVHKNSMLFFCCRPAKVFWKMSHPRETRSIAHVQLGKVHFFHNSPPNYNNICWGFFSDVAQTKN